MQQRSHKADGGLLLDVETSEAIAEIIDWDDETLIGASFVLLDQALAEVPPELHQPLNLPRSDSQFPQQLGQRRQKKVRVWTQTLRLSTGAGYSSQTCQTV